MLRRSGHTSSLSSELGAATAIVFGALLTVGSADGEQVRLLWWCAVSAGFLVSAALIADAIRRLHRSRSVDLDSGEATLESALILSRVWRPSHRKASSLQWPIEVKEARGTPVIRGGSRSYYVDVRDDPPAYVRPQIDRIVGHFPKQLGKH